MPSTPANQEPAKRCSVQKHWQRHYYVQWHSVIVAATYNLTLTDKNGVGSATLAFSLNSPLDGCCSALEDFCVLCIISALMYTRVARGTKCDQVLFGVAAGMAAKLPVMDLQVRHPAARLTAPAVPTQNLLTQLLVRYRV